MNRWAEEAVRSPNAAIENQFFPLFQYAAVGFAKVGLKGEWLRVNEKLCEMTGYSEAELLSMTFMDITHPEDVEADLRNMHQVMAGELNINVMEKRYIRKNGEVIWIQLTATLTRTPQGDPDYFITIIEDITERKKYEQSRNESEERFRFVLDGSNDGLYDWNILTNQVYWSERYYGILGLEPRETAPDFEEFVELIHPDDRERVIREIQDHLKTPEKYIMRYRLRHADGTYRHVTCRGRAFLNEEGIPIRMAGLVRDVTDNFEARQALQESEERFRTMADKAPIFIAMSDADTDLIYFNKQWLDFTGRTLEEEIRFGWLNGVHPDDREQTLNTYLEAYQEKREFEVEYRLRRNDGEYRWLFSKVAPRFTPSGQFAGYIGTCIDITERKQAEAALKRTLEFESLKRRVIAQITESFDIDHILRTATNEIGQFLKADRCSVTKYEMVNGQMNFDVVGQYLSTEEILPISQDDIQFIMDAARGLTPEALEKGQEQVMIFPDIEVYGDYLKQRLKELNLDLDLDTLLAMVKKYQMKSLLRVGILYRGIPYGSLSLHQCTYAREWQPDEIALLKDLAGHLGSALYQAELYRTEQQTRQHLERYTKKLEASNRELEEFATVASHDLQAPLRKVIMFSEYLRETVADKLPPESQEHIDRMQKATQKMQNLITDLLNLSRITRKGQAFRRIDLRESLENVISDLQFYIENVNGTVEVGPLESIEGDPTQIEQLFQNLLSNSLKFHCKGAPPVVKVYGEKVENDCYRVTVEDNGIGFDEIYLEKIFGIFERLCPSQYEGTGIGLAICHKIVERHNGSISATSKPGEGCKFFVTLPIRQNTYQN